MELRIPPEMPSYAEKHEIYHLIQSLVSSLMVHRPCDPVSFLIGQLRRGRAEVPKIILLGPPAAGKTTIARSLCRDLGSVHITADALLEENTELSNKYTLQDLPVQVWTDLIGRRLQQDDCFIQGWLLEGFPQTRLQALSLQEDGLIPDHVVALEAPDEVLSQRNGGRMLDLETGDVFHRTFIWPSDQTVAARLQSGHSRPEQQRVADTQRYRRDITGLSSAYQHVLKVINADQPHADVYHQVLSFVQMPRCSVAPQTPRILLFGPPGSGKHLQAKLLSDKYQLVNVSCSQVLRSVAAEGSALGQSVKPFIEKRQRVPDRLVLQALSQKLSRLDSTTRGFVLHGFPRTLEQARRLRESNYTPSRVFFLEMTDDVALERITLRATDPVTGEKFHGLDRPAPSAEVQQRLRTHPEDTLQRVQDALREYRRTAPTLQAFYPGSLYLDADLDPHSVLENLESRMFGRSLLGHAHRDRK